MRNLDYWGVGLLPGEVLPVSEVPYVAVVLGSAPDDLTDVVRERVLLEVGIVHIHLFFLF